MSAGLTLPPKATNENIYSNFDHQIDNEVFEFLKTNPDYWAPWTAWNFYAKVWYCPHDDGAWHVTVMQYHSDVETKSDDNLPELILYINDEYGWD
jgi:hypothetical protein